MDLLLNSLKFIPFLFLAVFVPGYVIVNRIKIEEKSLKVFLSITLGMVLLTLAGFVGMYLVYGLLAISLFFFVRDIKTLKLNFKTVTRLSFPGLFILLVIILGTIFQNAIAFKSGRLYDFGIGYWGPLGHDGVWHQALVNQILGGTPPLNPGLSGTVLTNYHYFYDLLVGITTRLTAIAAPELIFRIYPLTFSLLIGVGTYLLCRILFNKWYVAAASLFFVYFGGSFGYIVEWVRQRTLGGESAFWVNQPVSMNLNPPFAISLVLTIASVLAFYLFAKRKDFASGTVLAIISGVLIEFKVYAGLIVLFSLGAVSLVKLYQKETAYLKVFTASLALSLVVYIPNNSGSQNLVVFAPFWLVDSMIDFSDRVGWLKLSQARAAYLSGGVWPKYILAEAVSLGIFIVGNLGTRIVALLGLPHIIKKKFWRQDTYMFLMIITASSLIPSLLFIQKGNPWNTIQFMYYFLYFWAIFAGFGIIVFLKILPRAVAVLAILLLIPASSISSFSTFRSAFQGAPSRLTNEEASALAFLKSQPEGVVLTHPFLKELRKEYTSPYPLAVYETSAYVSAFSGKVSFIEDEFQQDIFQNDYKGRLAESNKFFDGNDNLWNKKFLSENKIVYIYLPKLYGITLNERALGVEMIFSNQEAEVYQTRQ